MPAKPLAHVTRYAVIDRDEQGRESLAYVVNDRNEAEELCEPGGVIIQLRPGSGLRTAGNGIVQGDDGRPETGERLAAIAREYEVTNA